MENDKQYLERGVEYIRKALQKLELQTLCDHLPSEKFTKIVESIYREQGLVVEDKKVEALKAVRTVKINNCPYCQFPIKQESEVVTCQACKIPHHRECWEENGGCTTFGCRGTTAASAISGRADTSDRINITAASLSNDITDAAYVIDNTAGDIPLADLEIGARVVDPSWQWQFRTGQNYTGTGETKAVTWIVVAKNHYSGLSPHVTLLASELIGQYCFGKKGTWLAPINSNHWGESSMGNDKHVLRTWLNSTGIYPYEGFYSAFSKSFKQAVLTTTLPNRTWWKDGSFYNTQDKVFVPSSTELGDTAHNRTYHIGTIYPHFLEEGNSKRITKLSNETWWYWTRSPHSTHGNRVRAVTGPGEFIYGSANHDYSGVRPALNLKSEILVSEIRN